MNISKAHSKAVGNCMRALGEWLDRNDEDRGRRGYDPRLDDAASDALNAVWYLEEFVRQLAALDAEGRA